MTITPLLRRLFGKPSCWCVCGHDRESHQHWRSDRSSTSCAHCNCVSFLGDK